MIFIFFRDFVKTTSASSMTAKRTSTAILLIILKKIAEMANADATSWSASLSLAWKVSIARKTKSAQATIQSMKTLKQTRVMYLSAKASKTVTIKKFAKTTNANRSIVQAIHTVGIE